MFTPQDEIGRYRVGMILLLLGAVGLVLGIILGPHDLYIRDFGLLASGIGAGVERWAYPSFAPGMFIPIEDPTTAKNSRRELWIVSIALVPFFAASLLLLHIDVVTGAPQIWPFYVFAVVAVVCFLVWLQLAIKIAGSWGRNN